MPRSNAEPWLAIFRLMMAASKRTVDPPGAQARRSGPPRIRKVSEMEISALNVGQS